MLPTKHNSYKQADLAEANLIIEKNRIKGARVLVSTASQTLPVFPSSAPPTPAAVALAPPLALAAPPSTPTAEANAPNSGGASSNSSGSKAHRLRGRGSSEGRLELVGHPLHPYSLGEA